MRGLDPEVANAVWEAAKGLLPAWEDNHPLGCHNPRKPDRVCFRGILIRLVTGCSWETAEQLLNKEVSDTTLRARRDEWMKAGVFENLEAEALAAYDRVIGLDLSEVSVDGSRHKAPSGGEGTGKEPLRPGQIRPEMVPGHRPQRHTDRLGHKRRRPSRQHPIPTQRRSCQPTGPPVRCRDPPPRPRLRQQSGARPLRRRRHNRRHMRQEKTTRPNRQHQNTRTPRYALDRRTNQLMAHQLRATPPQHRPKHPPPTRPTQPSHHPHHHHQTHQMARPLQPQLTPTRGRS